jgi:CRP-like cAMP-binding protein
VSSRETNKRLKELAAALKAEPGSIPRRLELAAALREAGRAVDAIELYRGVAAVYAEEGRLVQAMAVCKGILEIDPEHRDSLELLATLAARRAQRRTTQPSVDVKQVDGRWVVEPQAGAPGYSHSTDEVTPASVADFSPARKPKDQFAETATRTGSDADSTRAGSEEVSAVRAALWSRTPPFGTKAIPGPEPPGIEIAAEGADGPDTDPQRLATPIESPSLDFPDETKRLARGDKLLELPKATQRELDTLRTRAPTLEDAAPLAEQERYDTPIEPVRTEDATRAATPAALAAAEAAGPSSNPPLHAEEDTGVTIQQAITAPFPRPQLLVEAPPFPLLSDLPRSAFMELLARLNVLRLDTGATVLQEGDHGDACYLVASGSVRVTKNGVELAVLGPGSFFGEFAVLADQRRHASVSTIEPVELLEITRQLLDELVAAHPGVARTLRKFYRERLLATLMATAPFFANLKPEERAAIAERFRPRRFGRGARIVEEASAGGGLYLILVGEVEVVRGAAESEVRLGALGEGSYFGEMSLLRGGTASATVRAARMTEVVQLPPRDFYEVVSQHPVLWEQLRSEAERREMANVAILAGEARKSDDGTIYLV